MLNSKNLVLAVSSLFFIYFLYIVFIQIKYNIIGENGYTLGDWLITYHDGGFKRRGLSGSLLIWVQEFWGISFKKTVYVIQYGLYLFFIVGLFNLIRKAQVNLLYLGILFSSATFLFFINDLGSIGRKEIILFGFYALYLNLVYYFPKNYTLLGIYLFVSTIIGCLMHEIYFFYLPFFVLPFLHKIRFQNLLEYRFLLSAFVPGFVIVVALKLWGVEINEGHTFELFQGLGLGESMSKLGNLGILTWNDNFDKNAYFGQNQYGLYLISLVIAVLQFYLYTDITRVFNGKYKFLLITLITFLWSLPAYVLAIDWGRWLNIQFIMTLLWLTYMQIFSESFKPNKKPYYYWAFVVLSICLGIFWKFELVDIGFIIRDLK